MALYWGSKFISGSGYNNNYLENKILDLENKILLLSQYIKDIQEVLDIQTSESFIVGDIDYMTVESLENRTVLEIEGYSNTDSYNISIINDTTVEI